MRFHSVPFLAVCLVICLTVRGPATAQEKTESVKWTGTTINADGKTDCFVEITEDKDGTLTGKWGSPGNELKIEKGERVTAEVLRWESSSDTHRWVVQAKVNGKSMTLDYTATSKMDGKIKGGVGAAVLAKE